MSTELANPTNLRYLGMFKVVLSINNISCINNIVIQYIPACFLPLEAGASQGSPPPLGLPSAHQQARLRSFSLNVPGVRVRKFWRWARAILWPMQV